MPVTVVLIRHGETDWNRIKRIQGHHDVPLSADGFAQAERIADRLEREALDGVRFDALYSSDLCRAQQTAEPIARALGLPLELEPAFRERAYGRFEGFDADQIRDRFPADYAEWQRRDPRFEPPGGGESQRAFFLRVTDALRGIVAAQRDRRVVIVAHGGVLDCAYRYATDMPLDVPRDYPLLNGSINEIEFDADEARVVSWADVRHLHDGEVRDDSGIGDPSTAGGLDPRAF